MVIEQCKDIMELKSLAEEWAKESRAGEFGLDVDLNIVKSDMESWLEGQGAVLVAREGDEILAMFALFAVPSYLGNQKIALEKYWYARKGCHFVGPQLYTEAVKWARENGCSHLITSGSKMASGSHDSICRFLENTGARHFETSYIYEIGDA